LVDPVSFWFAFTHTRFPLMNSVHCPNCGRVVDDTGPACPSCGEKIFVEHPADIQPIRHRILTYPDEHRDETPNDHDKRKNG